MHASDASADLLRVRDLVTGYGPVSVLNGVSITVGPSEAVSILGPNGAGKTTLLRAISGVLPIASGSVELVHSVPRRMAPHLVVRSGLGHVPEGRAIFPGLSVEENLLLGTFARSNSSRSDDAALLDDVLELFPWMRARLAQPGGTLSGGEQQMLAIGRALMGRPRILLLDEPSLGLSPIMVSKVFEILHTIRDRGVSIILVEQNLTPALELTDRGYVMNRGRVVLEGSSDELAASDVFSSYLGVA